MEALAPILFGLLILAAFAAALLASRGRQVAQQLESTEARLRDAEERAREAQTARLGMQARLQGVDDADAERNRIIAEVHAAQRQLQSLQEQRQKADAELADVQRRLVGLRAELAPLDERAMLPLEPRGPADRPEMRG